MRVSLIMPTFNRAYCIERAIRSVEAQTFQDWELIIVDDGSTDGTENVVAPFRSSIGDRLDYVQVPNGGGSAARNTGIFRASGEYIGFLDSDDYFYPEKLAVQMAMFHRFPEAAMCFSNWSTFYDGGEPGLSHHSMPATFRGRIYPSLLTVARNCIVTPSVVLRRDALFNSGFFDTSMAICEDIDLWRRVCRQGDAIKVDTPLLGVHLRKSDTFAYRDSLEGRLRLYEKAHLEDQNLPMDFFGFLFSEIFRTYAELADYRRDRPQADALWRAESLVCSLGNEPRWLDLVAICREAIAACEERVAA
jgi:glycosyltransferase involved in cell wall biosynthesis